MTADGAVKPDAIQPAPTAAPGSTAAAGKLVPSETGKLKVFISYSRADIGFADELDAGLQVMGFATSLDRHSIVEGEDWKKRLGGLIADADTVVFVISPDSAGSPVCQWEIDEAVRLSKRILPVLWRPTGTIPVPEKLAALNYVRFDEARSFMAGLKALTRALETAARLAPALASAHDGIAWAAFLDVALRAKPVETLKDVLADAEKAVSLAPDDSGILDTRGQIYLALGRTDAALADLDKAITLGLDSIGTTYARGRAHDLKGNRDAAIADYGKAISGDAGDDDWRKHAQSQARARLEALGVAP